MTEKINTTSLDKSEMDRTIDMDKTMDMD